ncbi:MAG TPA: hypothetical protein VK999_05650 [Methylotenera sp.]|nr:hypothetical protein [Methylotenera sp.]
MAGFASFTFSAFLGTTAFAVLLAGAGLAITAFAAGLTAVVFAATVLAAAALGEVDFVAGAVLLAEAAFSTDADLSTGALNAAACTGLIFDIKIPFIQINDINSLYRLYRIANEFFMTMKSGGQQF